ncbi:hypothetical protein B8281_16010 [Cellulosimicrobium sp. TH-20]|nr:hypothetical protein B8281_16010 [Cellulosimicrobium sp. TH-20]
MDGLLKTVIDQTRTWLREKKDWDVDLSWTGTLHHPDGRRLDVRHHESSGARAFRLVMEERNEAGRFRTRLTSVEGPSDGWVSLDVLNDMGNYVATPNLARFLLASLPLADGPAELSVAPRRVHVSGIEEVRELLEHPRRHGVCLIAGTDDRLPYDRFADLVGKWTDQVVGLGHVIVLDPGATADFSRVVGRAWEAPPWTVRTYLPGIDLSRTAEARANRILGTARLGNVKTGYLKSLLGGVARQIGASRPTPPELASWRRTFERLETAAVTSAMRDSARPARTPGPPPPPSVPAPTAEATEADRHLAELRRVRETLGVKDLDEATLLEVLDRATSGPSSEAMEQVSSRMEALQEQVDALRLDVERRKEDLIEEQTDVLELQETVEVQQRRIAWLGSQLVKLERADLAYGVDPDEQDPAPASYVELVERLPSLEERGVAVRCDEDTVLGLQEIDHASKALLPTWQALMALVDFVRARADGVATGGVQQYLEEQPMGYRMFPHNRHAPTETGTTMERYGEERKLPVPEQVSPTGFATMRAHFKLARIARHDPRLYYLDDTAGSGLVCVGYIGRHLTNTQT